MADKPKKSGAKQVDLFGETVHQVRPPAIRPWREIEPGRPTEDQAGLEALDAYLFALVARDRRFLRALAKAGVPDDLPEVSEFSMLDQVMLANLALLRLGRLQPVEAPVAMESTGEIAGSLAELRAGILTGLDPEISRRVMASEQRMRAEDHDLRREVTELAFSLAEPGELAEFSIPLSDADDEDRALREAGFITGSMLGEMVDSFQGVMRAEIESRPLPRRCGLASLLKALPVVWLDAIASTLGFGPGGRRSRREAAVADHLKDPDHLAALVGGGLGDPERACLAFLLDQGGQAKAAAVTRRFGDDADDGHFWQDEPPTSTLGRLRLHGLVFVGKKKWGRQHHRTAAIPAELRDPLADLLAGGDAASG